MVAMPTTYVVGMTTQAMEISCTSNSIIRPSTPSSMIRTKTRLVSPGSSLLLGGSRSFSCSALIKARAGKKPKKAATDQGSDEKPKMQFHFHKMDPQKMKELQDAADKKQEEWKKSQKKSQDDKSSSPFGDWKSNLGSLVVTTILTTYLTNAFRSDTQKQLSWEEFRSQYLNQGLVEKIVVVNKKIARATVKNSIGPVVFTIGSIDAFDRHMDEAQRESGLNPVPVSYKKEISLWSVAGSLLPTVLILGGIYYLSRRGLQGGAAGGIMNIGKSKAKKFNEETNIKVKFKDVAGADEAKEEIMEFVQFLKTPAKYERLGAKIPRGAILSGPPGTGKTLLAKATAGEAGVPFYSVSGSEFVEMFVGVGASRVRDLFAKARENAPSIVFIDEIDAIGRARGPGEMGGGAGGGNDERESTLNQLLVELDGFSNREHVVVLAGTNRPDILDQALKRPGRFDRQITIDKPDVGGRKQVYQIYLKKIKTGDDLTDLDKASGKLAALTPGFSGADIANVVNEAALIAARMDSKQVQLVHFEQAIERVSQGIENRSRIPPPEERKAVAYHEAGHAICSWYLQHADPFLKVTIIPRGQSLGYARYLPSDTELPNELELADKLVMALGGRVSEKMYTNTTSSGAQSDFQTVTDIATRMVVGWGMSPKIGWVNYHEEGSYYTKPFSEETAELIDGEVRRIVETAHTKCENLLEEHWSDVVKLAEALLERETLTRADLIKLIGPRPFPEKTEEFKYLEDGLTQDLAADSRG